VTTSGNGCADVWCDHLNPRARRDELPQLARGNRPAANKDDEPSGQIQKQRQ
jgi:hypothetical protein